MARKYMEKKQAQIASPSRTTIPSTLRNVLRVPESKEFYEKATPFVQRTRLFLQNEQEDREIERDEPGTPDSVLEPSESFKNPKSNSPKKKLFGFASGKTVLNFIRSGDSSSDQEKSPSKTSRIFKFQSSPKKDQAECSKGQEPSYSSCFSEQGSDQSGCVTFERQVVPGISYAPGWSLKGEHLMKWQENGKTTLQVSFFRIRIN